MPGKTTRNYYQQMLDFIKEERFCILPSNLIQGEHIKLRIDTYITRKPHNNR